MTTTLPAPPAGWYASGISNIARYWDGQAWTPHLWRGGVATTIQQVQRSLRVTQIGWASIAGAVILLTVVFAIAFDGASMGVWPLVVLVNVVGGAIAAIWSTSNLRVLRTGPARFQPIA